MTILQSFPYWICAGIFKQIFGEAIADFFNRFAYQEMNGPKARVSACDPKKSLSACLQILGY